MDHDDYDDRPLPVPPYVPSNASQKSRRHTSSSSRRNSEVFSVYEGRLRDMKQLLDATTSQFHAEARRASEAEEQVQQVTAHLKRMNDARLAALQEAARANEELRLYKLRLHEAQEQILRAQETVDKIERQRYQAEKDVAEARTNLRKLHQRIVVQAARDEGRRSGMREGIQLGRAEGFQHGHATAQWEMEEYDAYYDEEEYSDEYYRPPSRYISSSENTRPSRQQRRTASPPSSPSPPPPPVQPRAVPPESVPPSPSIRPRSFRNASPSARHSPIAIPPDGFIPSLDPDHQIRIPPPHELSRPPSTSERVASPQPPNLSDHDAIPIPPRAHRVRRPQPSSPGSNSTALSQFDMVNDPGYTTGRRSPLSVIAEVRSTHTSPNPQSMNGGQDLRHQSSWGGSSRRSNGNINATPRATATGMEHDTRQPQIGPYTRPRPTSSSTGSVGPANPSKDRRFSSVSTVPDIDIQPPSRPISSSTPRSNPNSASSSYLDPSHANKPYEPEPSSLGLFSTAPISGVVADLPPGFQPTGGLTPASTHSIPGGYSHFQNPGPHSDVPPVIPGPDLLRRSNNDSLTSDDTLASPPRAPSLDTLSTTPPGRVRAISVDTLMTPPPVHGRTASIDTLMTPPPIHGRAMTADTLATPTHTRVSMDTLMTPAPEHIHRPNAPEAIWADATRAAGDAIPIPTPFSNSSQLSGSGIHSNQNGSGVNGSVSRKKKKKG